MLAEVSCCVVYGIINMSSSCFDYDDCILLLIQHELGNTEKPEEIFDIIEHFCLGRRRLHLFGTDATIRPGIIHNVPYIYNIPYSQKFDIWWSIFVTAKLKICQYFILAYCRCRFLSAYLEIGAYSLLVLLLGNRHASHLDSLELHNIMQWAAYLYQAKVLLFWLPSVGRFLNCDSMCPWTLHILKFWRPPSILIF